MKTPEEFLTRGKGNFINCTDYDDAILAMKEYAKQFLPIESHEVPDAEMKKTKQRVYNILNEFHARASYMTDHACVDIINEFKPHMRSQMTAKSDAVEFGEWICKEGYNSVQILVSPRWSKGYNQGEHTSEELYSLFLKQK